MTDLHDTIRAALDPSTGYRDLDDRAREWLGKLLDENAMLLAAMPTDEELRAMEAAVLVVRVQHGPDRGPADTGLAMVGLSRLCRARAKGGT